MNERLEKVILAWLGDIIGLGIAELGCRLVTGRFFWWHLL